MEEKQNSPLKKEKLTFTGREFIKKGQGKFGEWKLFRAKFESTGGMNFKFTAFSNPKSGKCISSLVEGEDYTVFFVEEEKTFTNEQGEEVTYTARTIRKIIEEKEEGGESSSSSSPVHEIPSVPKINLKKEIVKKEILPEDFEVEHEEYNVLKKISDLGIQVSKQDFVYTLQEELKLSNERIELLWNYWLLW